MGRREADIIAVSAGAGRSYPHGKIRTVSDLLVPDIRHGERVRLAFGAKGGRN
jgi:hypothetical protein